jgi:hypothetical protein
MIAAEHGGAVWAANSDGGPMFSFVLPFHTGQSQAGEVSIDDSICTEVI